MKPANPVVKYPRVLFKQLVSVRNFHSAASTPAVQQTNLQRTWWHVQDDIFWRHQQTTDYFDDLPTGLQQLTVFRDNVIDEARENILGPQVEKLVEGDLDLRDLVYHGLTDTEFLSECAQMRILPRDPVDAMVHSLKDYHAEAKEIDVGRFRAVIEEAVCYARTYDGRYPPKKIAGTLIGEFMGDDALMAGVREGSDIPSEMHERKLIVRRSLHSLVESSLSKLALRDDFDWPSFIEGELVYNAVSAGLLSKRLVGSIGRMCSDRATRVTLEQVETKHDRAIRELEWLAEHVDSAASNHRRGEHSAHKRTVRGLALASLPLSIGGSAVLIPQAIQSISAGSSSGSIAIWSALALANVLWALGSIVIAINPKIVMSGYPVMSSYVVVRHRNLED